MTRRVPNLTNISIMIMRANVPRTRRLVNYDRIHLTTRETVSPMLQSTSNHDRHNRSRTRHRRNRLIIMLNNQIIRRTLKVVRVINSVRVTRSTRGQRQVNTVQRNVTRQLHHDNETNNRRRPTSNQGPRHLTGVPSLRAVSSPSSIFSDVSRPNAGGRQNDYVLRPPHNILS